MLLAAALALPALYRDVFDVDEAATAISACARHLGPCTPAEAVSVSARWPDHAWGKAIVFSQWGRLVGWSELAIRALSWLLGPLALAWLYRLGRELFSANIALAATFLLSTSVLFLSYMHIARSYTAVMLLAAIITWSYWRVALGRRPPGRGDCIALLLASTAMLYTHYLGALLLPALGLVHLLLAGLIGKRRWWITALLLALALLLAAPQVGGLYDGIQFNLAKEHLREVALRYPDIITQFARYLSNGLFFPQRPFNILLVAVLLLCVIPLALRRRIRRQLPGPTLFLALAAALNLLLLLGANEWLRVLASSRVRYLATLWPAAMLLLSAAFHRLLLPVARCALPVALVLIALPGALDFLQQGDLVRRSWGWREFPVSIRVVNMLAREGAAQDLLLVDVHAFRFENRSYEFYTGAWGERRAQLTPDTSPDDLSAQALAYRSVWLLYRHNARDELRVDELIERLGEEGWVAQQTLHEREVALEQYLSPPAAGVVLQFERQIRLSGFRADIQDNQLEVRAGLHSKDDHLLARFSLALHVIDPRNGQRVAQGDVGVGPGGFVALRSVMDVSDLPPGDYELHLALYDWQTGERLSARHLASGAVGDMHVLHTFRVGDAP